MLLLRLPLLRLPMLRLKLLWPLQPPMLRLRLLWPLQPPMLRLKLLWPLQPPMLRLRLLRPLRLPMLLLKLLWPLRLRLFLPLLQAANPQAHRLYVFPPKNSAVIFRGVFLLGMLCQSIGPGHEAAAFTALSRGRSPQAGRLHFFISVAPSAHP